MYKNLTLGLCALLLAACSATPTPAPAVQPTQAEQASNTPRPPTFTLRPTITNTPFPPTRTTRPTRTDAPPTETEPRLEPTLTRTLAPAFTATQAPVNTAPPADTAVPVATAEPTQAPAATEAPTQAPPAGDSISLVSLTSPINPGQDASLVIQTTAGASCFLAYTTPAGNPSTAQGLGGTTADGNGRCGWSWKIGTNTGAGTGKLFVSAGTANASFDIVIQ